MAIALLRRHAELLMLSGFAALSALVHLVPFLRGGAHPLGYDTGFYRRYLIEPAEGFVNAPVPGLGDDALVPRLILDTARVLGTPPDIALYGTYFAFFLIAPLLLYFILKPHVGTRGASIGSLFFILSPVAYTTYWYFLYKNAAGIVVILLAALAIERRVFPAIILLDVAIALTHKTSAVIYLAMLGAFTLISPARIKETALHATVTLAVLALVAFPALEGALRAAPIAVFIGWNDYLRLSIPFLIAILVGAFTARHIPFPKTLLALAGASLAFPVFGLPFYERIFVFADVAAAALAAWAIEGVLRSMKQNPQSRAAYVAMLCVVVGSLLGSLWYQMKTLHPLVSEAEIARIQEIATLVPSEATILTTTDEAPWFEGWTRAHIAAPGMLNDIHDYEEWVGFWNATSTVERISFLSGYSRPLYVSIAGDYSALSESPCVQKIAPTLLRIECTPNSGKH